MQYQAIAVLNAKDEGFVEGVIAAYEKLHSNCTKAEIIDFLKQFGSKDVDYWIEWFGLNKEN